MNWQLLINPFSRVSEKQLLFIGLFFLLLNGFVCFYSQTFMNSIFHFAVKDNITLLGSYVSVLICYSTAIIFLFVLALFFNKKTRLIDIVTTVLISQAFNFIVLLITKFSGLDKVSTSIKTAIEANQIDKVSTNISLLLVLILPLLFFAFYGIVLIFNGFKTATNIKKPEQITAFIVLLFLFLSVHQVVFQYIDL